MSKTIEQKVADFWNGWAGKELKAKLANGTYKAEATWHIRGEDPNCDFGGHHHMPHIAHVHGNIYDIVKLAVQHKKFYQWGSGGDFTPISALSIEEFTERVVGEDEIALFKD